MKKLSVLILLLFASSFVFAGDFIPVNKLDITVDDFVQYDFDGSPVDIPVLVSGPAARAYLVVETTGLAGNLERVTNGRIGWHTVNNIDTTVYHSAGNDLETGQKSITWSGKDNDGNNVADGTYSYYVFAFDYANESQAAYPTTNGRPFLHNCVLVTTEDVNGVPYPKPMWTTKQAWGDEGAKRIWCKWLLGNDPYNPELMETCYIPDDEGWNLRGAPRMAFDPEDYDYVFHFTDKAEGKDSTQQAVYKEKIVSNDIAERVADWGADLTWTYEGYTNECGVSTDGTYLYTNWWINSQTEANPLLLIYTLDGEKVEDVYLNDWDKTEYVSTHPGVKTSGGPRNTQNNNGHIYMHTIWCMRMITDPLRYIESGEYDDLIVAINEEGDGICDKGWSADNPYADYCFAEDPPWNYSMYGTKYGFSLTSVERAGPISFALMCPDMTAIGYCTVAGETDNGTGSLLTLIRGTAYDGLYKAGYGTEYSAEDALIRGWFLGADVDKGTIGKTGTSVAAAAPSAFAVDQNSPNPCNPTTTINFTIPEAGNVTVDVFNVAGQKVDTLVNDFMDTGKHSVLWDGSNSASGVYFYTVTSGEFSRTMKMTLLK